MHDEEHNKNLTNFFKKCSEVDIRLNKEKVELRTASVTFIGHVITKDGITPDSENLKAIEKFPNPTNLEELRRFLGMINYLARNMPSVNNVLHPLHNLMKKDVPFVWSTTQDKAFQCVKQMVVACPSLSFYDPNKELVVENDASEYGMGSALMQEGKPIAFISRALSAAEKNYAQIEKELLAIMYGLQKFRHYTYGRHVEVITDFKPLVGITN